MDLIKVLDPNISLAQLEQRIEIAAQLTYSPSYLVQPGSIEPIMFMIFPGNYDRMIAALFPTVAAGGPPTSNDYFYFGDFELIITGAQLDPVVEFLFDKGETLIDTRIFGTPTDYIQLPYHLRLQNWLFYAFQGDGSAFWNSSDYYGISFNGYRVKKA